MSKHACTPSSWMHIFRIAFVLVFGVMIGSHQLQLVYGLVSAPEGLLRETTQTFVSGTIATDTTWTLAGSPYVVTGNVFVSTGIRLTVEPGVEVRVQASKGIQVDGTLVARGTSLQLIIFTSDSSTPSPGDWAFLKFTDSSTDAVFDSDGNYVSGSILEYATVEYAGGGTSPQGAIVIESSAPFISHSTIRRNIVGVYRAPPTGNAVLRLSHNLMTSNIGGLGIYVLGNSIISNNTMLNTTPGILAVPSAGQTAQLIDNLVTNVGNYGIFVAGEGTTSLSNNRIVGNPGIGIRKQDLGIVTITKNLIDSNGGGGIGVYNGTISITDNIIKNNSSSNGFVPGGGISVSADGDTSVIHSATIARNILVGNTAIRGGGIGISSNEATFSITGNAFISNTASDRGAAIYSHTFLNNTNHTTIQNNTFTRHSGDATINANSTPSIQNNNFYSNMTAYDIYCGNSSSSAPIDATNNWWGTTSDTEIQNRIFDRNDDITVGFVNYTPIRIDFNLSAPLLPPTGLIVSPSGGGNVTLSWLPNPEADIAGYKVYYDVDSGFPYTGTGATQGSSPVDVGNVNGFTLSGLTPGTYYFTVTAYDTDRDGIDDQTDGNESWFSTEILTNNFSADLSISQSVSADPIVVGSNLTYTIVVANNGPDSAGSVVVTDNLPSGVAFLDCSSTGGGICSGSGNSRTVTFASLAANSPATITIVAGVDCSVTNGTIISNTASATSLAGDNNPGNNSATKEVTVSNPPPMIAPTGHSFAPDGGLGTVNVTVPAGCGWTALSNDNWINITSGSSGTGNGSVGYSVAPNNSLNARSGSMTVANQTFSVDQAGIVCTYSLIPTSRSHSSSSGTDIISVNAASVCAWTAGSNAPWLMITGGASGAGDGIVTYSFQTNAGPARMGTATVAGQTFTVTQESGCSYSLDRDHQSHSASTGAHTINVAAGTDCSWTVTNHSPSFITITSGSGASGNGSVSYSITANTSNSPRTGVLTIAGHTFTVYQGIDFLDVPSNDVFYTVIGQLSARGVTLGCGNGNFCPNDPVTREQMAAFILRAKGEFNPPTPASQRFNDVPPQNVFYNFIDRLAVLQITLGCTPDHLFYCPTDPVKREQMSAFLLRGLGEFNPPTPPSQRFNDVPPANVFYNFIDRMAVLNITLGCTPDHLMYCPNDSVTRAQMAAFLVRAFNL